MEDKRFNWKDVKVTIFGKELDGIEEFRMTHKEQRQHEKFLKPLRGNLTKIRIPRKLKKHIKARTNIIQAPPSTLIALYNLGWRSDNKVKLGSLTIK